jgi:hypothetical protein
MFGVLAAVRAELLQRHPVGVVSAVLLGDVIAVLTNLAGQSDLGPELGGGHDGAFRYGKLLQRVKQLALLSYALT